MVVAAFNQEKALVGAFSVIVQLHRLIDLRQYLHLCGAGWCPLPLVTSRGNQIMSGARRCALMDGSQAPDTEAAVCCQANVV